jgi:hypothetical protein
MMTPAHLATFAVILFAVPALGQIVTDGDTIKLDGTTYRIWASMLRRASKPVLTAGWRARKRRSPCSS